MLTLTVTALRCVMLTTCLATYAPEGGDVGAPRLERTWKFGDGRALTLSLYRRTAGDDDVKLRGEFVRGRQVIEIRGAVRFGGDSRDVGIINTSFYPADFAENLDRIRTLPVLDCKTDGDDILILGRFGGFGTDLYRLTLPGQGKPEVRLIAYVATNVIPSVNARDVDDRGAATVGPWIRSARIVELKPAGAVVDLTLDSGRTLRHTSPYAKD
jgi:hypothetical protein